MAHNHVNNLHIKTNLHLYHFSKTPIKQLLIFYVDIGMVFAVIL